MLLNPTKTRFVTNFIMVERLFKLKPTIEQIVANPNLTTFVNSLCGNHQNHQKFDFEYISLTLSLVIYNIEHISTNKRYFIYNKVYLFISTWEFIFKI